MAELSFEDRCEMFVLPDFDEEHWTLCLLIPGIVPWKDKDKDAAHCAIRFEEPFSKKEYTLNEVVEIGKKACQRYGWLWSSDLFGDEAELIDFSVDPPKNLRDEK